MKQFIVHAGGPVFGTYEAETEQEARDLCAQDAGYANESDMEEQTGVKSDLVAQEV